MSWARGLQPNCPGRGEGMNSVQSGCMEPIPTRERREKCPDCDYCQTCSVSRCRLCKLEGRQSNACTLGTGFTYGAYLEWKKAHEQGPGSQPV